VRLDLVAMANLNLATKKIILYLEQFSHGYFILIFSFDFSIFKWSRDNIGLGCQINELNMLIIISITV